MIIQFSLVTSGLSTFFNHFREDFVEVPNVLTALVLVYFRPKAGNAIDKFLLIPWFNLSTNELFQLMP